MKSYLFVIGCNLVSLCPHACAADLPFGQSQTGTISSAAQSNSYTFLGGAGDVVDFTLVVTSGSLVPKIRLYNPNGTQLSSNYSGNPFGCSGSTLEMNTVQLPAAGTYTVLVGDCLDTNTGNYALYAQRTNNPTGAADLPFGQSQTGTISSAAQSNSYTFSANANDVVDFTLVVTSGSLVPKIRLYNPNGTQLNSNYSGNPFGCSGSTLEMNTVQLPATGTYTVLVGDCSDTKTGNYEIYTQRTDSPTGPVGLLFGQVQAGSISSLTQSNTYTFSANANDDVDFTLVVTSGSLVPKIRLYNPNGTQLSSNYSGNPFGCSGSTLEMNTVQLAATGTYTVLVGDCSDTKTGNYEIYTQRTNNPTGAANLPFAQVQIGLLGSVAGNNSYTFSASANDVVDFTLVVTSGSLVPKIRLYNPNGTQLSSNYGGNPFGCSGSTLEMNTVQLPATGTYTVLVGDCGDTNTGNYAIYMQRTNNPIAPIGLLFGQVQTGTVGSAAQSNSYTFLGSAGDVVDFTLVVTSGSLVPKIRLYNPNGTQLSSNYSGNPFGCSGSTVEINSVKLTQSGVYTTLLGDCSDTKTGNYNLSSQCFGVCSLPLPAPTLTSLSPTSASAGGSGFTLTVNGSNFVSGPDSLVYWNGSSRITTYVSSTQLTVAVLASDIATPGTFPVTVLNPNPLIGPSNAITFTVTNPVAGQPLQITTTSLQNASSGAPYSTTLAAKGGSGTGYKWSLSSGLLPSGFTLSSAGVLSSTGSPAAPPNAYGFTVQITDSAGNLATQALILVIICAQGCSQRPLLSLPSAVPSTFAYAGGTVTLSVAIQDAGAGGIQIAAAKVQLPDGTTTSVPLVLAAGSATNGTWRGQYTLPTNFGQASQVYNASFSALDDMGNLGQTPPVPITVAAPGPSDPSIQLTSVPPFGSSSVLSGRVTNVSPQIYQIAILIFIEGLGWYSKPYCSPLYTTINPDGTWSASVTTGGVDNTATQIVAYLVSSGTSSYTCVAAGGGLPASLESVAVAKVLSTRTDPNLSVLQFAGMSWWVKSNTVPLGPGMTNFSSVVNNPFVDGLGRLHLELIQVGEKWYGAEVVSNAVLGSGRFSFQLDTDETGLDPNVVLGLFTWSNDTAFANREIDVELSRFGNPNDTNNAQFVVQPFETPGNLLRFLVPSGTVPSSYSFLWYPRSVSFEAAQGSGADPANPQSVIKQWTNSQDVPQPGNQNVRMNLWLYNATAPANGQPVEVIIHSFQFNPLTVTADSVSPGSGAGATQTFTVHYSDSAGVADLNGAQVWFSPNAPLSPGQRANSCLVFYSPAGNQLYLENDAGTGWLGPAPVGGYVPLNNSQCSVNAQSASVVSNSNQLTLGLPVTFFPGFGGTTNVYAYASGATVASGWQTRGTWTIPSAPSSSSVNITSVGNGASFDQSFTPGMLMSVFGTGLSSGNPQTVTTTPLPLTSLSGTSVTINGISAPLMYISATQINLQIPYEVSGGTAVLTVNAGGQSGSISFTIQAAAPGIFVDSQNGHIVPNESATAGSTIGFFLTGAGQVTPSEATGNVPAAGTTPVPNLPLTMTVGGVPVTPVYVGIPDWSVGVLQINFTVPATLSAGTYPVVVTIGRVSSRAALLTVENGSPVISVTPAVLNFQSQQGSTAQPQSLQIGGTAGNAWQATAATSSGGGWLSVSPGAGQIPASVTANVSSASLTPGTYQGSIIIQAPAATPSSTTISVTLTITAAKLAQTITFGALSNQVLGTPPFTLSATASSGLAVTFASNTTAVCTASGITVTLVAAGTCSITAGQPGNAIYAPATSVTQSFTVTNPPPSAPLSLCAAPATLPKGLGLGSYSPALCFQYSELGAQTYTLSVWLLETQTGNYDCASTQWCQATFTIDNTGGHNSAGQLVVVRNMDVFSYNGFLWVARMNGAEAQQPASVTTKPPPILNPIGDRTVTAGQNLAFVVSASDPNGYSLSFQAQGVPLTQGLPPGASFDTTTGKFSWPSPVSGTYQILFNVVESTASPLNDSELVTITVR